VALRRARRGRGARADPSRFAHRCVGAGAAREVPDARRARQQRAQPDPVLAPADRGSMTVSTAQRRRVLLTVLQFIDLAVVATCLVITLVLMSDEMTLNGWLDFFEIRLSLGNVLFGISYVLAWNTILRLRGLYKSQRLAPASSEVKEI